MMMKKSKNIVWNHSSAFGIHESQDNGYGVNHDEDRDPFNLGKVIVITRLSKIMMMRFTLSTVLMLMMLMMLMLMLMTWVSPLTARNLPIRGSSGHTLHCQGDGIETMMMKSAQDIHVKFR